jgi:hypothetical protein
LSRTPADAGVLSGAARTGAARMRAAGASVTRPAR